MTRLVKTPEEIEKVRQSGKIAARVLRRLKDAARPGISTFSLDKLARELIAEGGGKPAFPGYRPQGARRPYRFAICASLNEGVVHGLPSPYRLKSGDVLKIDLGVDFQGGISDTAVTIPMGSVPKNVLNLIKATESALREGIRVVKRDKRVGDIGFAIERTVTAGGFKVIKGLTGHGVGLELHEEPTIYNYGKPGSGMVLKEGMILAIEPITSVSTGDIIQLKDDSFVTSDKSISAHFEHTVLITKKGAEVLTA